MSIPSGAVPLFASLRFKGGGALSVDLALSAEKNGIGGCLVGLRLMQECFPHSPVCIAPFGKKGRKGGHNLQCKSGWMLCMEAAVGTA